MNFENTGPLELSAGCVITTISGYNSTYSQNMDSTSKSEVPGTTPILVFRGSSNRVARNRSRVWLSTISKLYYFINAAGSNGTSSWGDNNDAPDAGEDVRLQYSFTGGSNDSEWTNLDSVDIGNLAGSNQWELRTVSVPEDAKKYSGVFLRFKQFNAQDNFDSFAMSSVLIDTGGSSGGSGGGSGLVLIDMDNVFSVTTDGAELTTISAWNASNADIPTLSPIIGTETPIGVFNSTQSGSRYIKNSNKVYLQNVETISFYYNQSSDSGWGGDNPDGQDENLLVQWSLDGLTGWNTLFTVDADSEFGDSSILTKWIRQEVYVTESAKTNSGVYLRLYQSSSSANFDYWAVTSLVINSLSSNTNSSFSIFDFSSGANNSYIGAHPTTISAWNSKFGDSMSSSTDVPSSSPICVFAWESKERTCTTLNKSYLINVNTLEYYINEADNSNWGEQPDGVSGEHLRFEYSVDGSSWQNLEIVQNSDVSTNTWTKRSVSVPSGAKTFSGVYLRFRQTDPDNADNWAITSVVPVVGGGTGTGTIIINDTSNTSVTRYIGLITATSGVTTETYVSSTKLTFSQSSGTLSATAFSSLSDISKKINIQEIKDPIGITQQLIGVRFDWIDTNKPSIGLIAQEVEKVIPEVIETDVNGFKTVNYDALIPILIESIKDHEKRIKKLELM
jgi:hypothetical protein